MKILVLTNLYPPHCVGGYEIICYTVVKELRARGHDVAILTSNHRANSVSGSTGYQPVPWGDSPDGMERASHTNPCAAFRGIPTVVPVGGSPTGAGESPAPPIHRGLSLGKQGAREGWDNGEQVERSLRIHGFYGHPWLGIHRLQRLEQHNNETLRAALHRFDPDLVYVWNMGGLSKSMLFTLQDSAIPTVFYLSDHWIARGLRSDVWLRWWNTQDGPLHQRLLRGLWNQSGLRQRWDAIARTSAVEHLQFRRIYFCSRALRELTVKAAFDVAHGAIIYVPVDMSLYQGEPHLASVPLKRLLYVGRLAPDKGVMTALRALAFLRGKFAGSLSIYGGGDPQDGKLLKQFAEENRLSVNFASAQMDEMPEVYRSHDALLFTSEWPEPFALTPIEAMGCGLPVIGTMTGGSAELFRHHENALTYSAGKAHELGERILQLAGDGQLRQQIAENGQREARQRFDVPVIVNQIEEFLTETVATWCADVHREVSCVVQHG